MIGSRSVRDYLDIKIDRFAEDLLSVNENAIKTISSATYSITPADKSKLLVFTAACTITLADIPTSIGTQIDIVNTSGGVLTFDDTAPAVIRSKDSVLTMSDNYTAATLVKISSTDWLLVGSLS